MDYLNFMLCFLLACVAIYLLSTAKKGKEANPKIQPPGPFPLPIFGNLFSLGAKAHVSLTELARTYGPLMTLQLGQVPTVVISSAVVAKEALQKNDISFSSRTVSDAVRALNHHQNSVVWLPAVAQWRNLRKICNSQVFSNSRLENSQNLRRHKLKDLISYVQTCSESGTAVDIGQAAFTTTLNLLSNTFFSVDLGDPISEFAREFKEVVRAILHEGGKPNFADYFPLLRKVDPQGIRRQMSIHFGKMVGIFNTMINQRLQGQRQSESMQGNDVLDVLLGINQDKPAEIEQSKIPDLLVVPPLPPSPLKIHLVISSNGLHYSQFTHLNISFLQDLFTAGTDTTSSTLEWAMTELLCNSEKLKKAQAELEEIIGKGNPVEEPDISRLPYLQAIVKETFRLHPGVPLLLRKVDSDVRLFNYTVPKNAQVLVNVWAIQRDPEIWKEPNTFEPERFLGSEVDVKGRDFELIPFGAGRRICPGLPLATRMLHLMLASLIHGFDWKLEAGVSPENMDMGERFGLTLEKAQPLRAIPVRA